MTYEILIDLNRIEVNVLDPLIWDNETTGSTLVSIQNNSVGQWPTSWKIDADIELQSYFIGLKWESDLGTKIGWIEIDINSLNGEIEILDQGVL